MQAGNVQGLPFALGHLDVRVAVAWLEPRNLGVQPRTCAIADVSGADAGDLRSTMALTPAGIYLPLDGPLGLAITPRHWLVTSSADQAACTVSRADYEGTGFTQQLSI